MSSTIVFSLSFSLADRLERELFFLFFHTLSLQRLYFHNLFHLRSIEREGSERPSFLLTIVILHEPAFSSWVHALLMRRLCFVLICFEDLLVQAMGKERAGGLIYFHIGQVGCRANCCSLPLKAQTRLKCESKRHIGSQISPSDHRVKNREIS